MDGWWWGLQMTWLRRCSAEPAQSTCGSDQLLKENLEKKLNDKARQPTRVESRRHRVAFGCLQRSVEGGTVPLSCSRSHIPPVSASFTLSKL